MDSHRKVTGSRDSAVEDESASNSYPLGPTLTASGVNVSIFSAYASHVEIVFFDHADAKQPARVIKLNPALNRTSHYWHIFFPGIVSGQLYGYLVDGPAQASGEFGLTATKYRLTHMARAFQSASTMIVPLRAIPETMREPR